MYAKGITGTVCQFWQLLFIQQIILEGAFMI